MSGPSVDVPDDPALDAWLRGATGDAERDIDTRADVHLRDLADGREDLSEGPLFDLAADASAWIERAVEVRMRELPPVGCVPRRSRRLASVVALGIAAAAAVVLALALPRWRAAVVEREAAAPVDQAVRAVEDDEGGDAVRARSRIASDPPPREAAPALADPVEPAPTAAPPPALRRAKVDVDARVLELDAQAQARWRAGDLAGARALFAEIVRVAGKTAHAQMAYGELFTLAHQMGDVAGARKLWRAYVRSFPRGRHADDARAGLCRTAAAAERAVCWTGYLRDFPRGTYREVAERALAGGAGDP